MWFLWLAVVILFLVLLTAWICYRMAFFAVKEKRPSQDEYPIPPGKIYEPYRDTMVQWMKEVRAMAPQTVSITSHDGLKLWGSYYEFAPGAPIELMFHGYRGSAERDLCGGVQRCFALGRSALLVDQRTSGRSDGHVITFGIQEHRDCLRWVDFMVSHFGKDVKIILTGISMGAATVLLAAGNPLPKQVVGVLADCGYTSAKEMICKTIGEMCLPPALLYPFVKLGARLYGRFDLEEVTPLEAVKNCTVPVIFFHGEDDQFVPCEMSRRNFDVCPAPKTLVTIPGAGHGLSYPKDPEAYLHAAASFFTENGVPTEIVS